MNCPEDQAARPDVSAINAKREAARLGGSAHANSNASSGYHSTNGQIMICKTLEFYHHHIPHPVNSFIL
jgi:hypothetical protein